MFDPEYEDYENEQGNDNNGCSYGYETDPVHDHDHDVDTSFERIRAEVSSRDRRFKNIPKLTPSPATLKSASVSVTCLVCAKIITSDFESEQLFPGASTNALVCALSTIFDIPQSYYDELNLHSLPTPLYCSLCSSLIFNSLEILNNIQSLQSNLEVLKSELKTNLIRSYDDGHGLSGIPTQSGSLSSNSNGGVAKELIRQSLIQAWNEHEENFGNGEDSAAVSEETPDSLLGLEQDPISHMYSAEEVQSDQDNDINSCDGYIQYEEGTEEQPQNFFIQRSQSRSASQSDLNFNNFLPMTTVTEVEDEDGNGNENNYDNEEEEDNAQVGEPHDIKILQPKTERRQRGRGRVKGFLRIRKHRQNGRFPYICGLCGKGYKKQRSFQMHLMCHTEETKKEGAVDRDQFSHAFSPETKVNQPTIYDTVVSEVDDAESFEVDVDPSAITDNHQHQPSTSTLLSVTSTFSLSNIPGVEISPVIKVESQEQQQRSQAEQTAKQPPGRFRPKGILKIRRNRQYRNSAYACNFCGKGYSNYKSFVRHVKCHRGAVSVDPQELDEAYKDRFRGIFRLSGRQRKGKFRYRCTRCGKGYRNAKSFEVHVQCHSGEYGVIKPKPVKNDPDQFTLNPDVAYLSNTWTAAAATSTSDENHSLPILSTETGIRTTRASASRRLKILSNNSKKQAASYRRQFRGIFRIRNRNHGRSLPFKCNICGKGYKIARSFETHMKFHTGELTVKKASKQVQPLSVPVEPESLLNIDTLNNSVNYVNSLMSDVLNSSRLPSNELDELGEEPSTSTATASYHISGGVSGNNGNDSQDIMATGEKVKRQRGRPRVPGSKRRYRGIFRIRNYGRIGNFPYRCKVCGKGYKNVKSYKTHVVFHDQNGDCDLDEGDLDDGMNEVAKNENTDDLSFPVELRNSIDMSSLEVTYINQDHNSGRKRNNNTKQNAPTSTPTKTTSMQLRNRPEASTSSNSSSQGHHQHFCDLCKKDFSSAPRLKAHISYAHSSNSEFHCEKCDVDLPSRPALYQHMQGHLQERQEEKYFKSNFLSLSQHGHMESTPTRRRSTTTSDLRYVCKICGERFLQYGQLKEHSAVHEVT